MKNNEYGIIGLLIKLSAADTKFDNKEIAFIKEVSERIGISDDEFNDILNAPEDFILEVPKTEQERMSILYYLLFLMKIDSKAAKTESQMVRQLGVALGFRDSMVDEMVNVIVAHENKYVPPYALLKKIIKYSN